MPPPTQTGWPDRAGYTERKELRAQILRFILARAGASKTHSPLLAGGVIQGRKSSTLFDPGSDNYGGEFEELWICQSCAQKSGAGTFQSLSQSNRGNQE